MLLIEWVFIAVISFFAGVLDASVGGGGLILVPSLLFFNLNLKQAIASTRITFLMDSGSGALAHWKQKNISFSKKTFYLLLGATIGAFIGAKIAEMISLKELNSIYALFLIAMASIIMLDSKKFYSEKKFGSKTSFFGGVLIGALISLFGGGLGVIIIMFMVLFMGFNLLKAVGTSQIIVIAANTVALASYFFLGYVNFFIGFFAGVFAFLGALLGAVITSKLGEKKLKKFFFVIVVLLALKLLFLG